MIPDSWSKGVGGTLIPDTQGLSLLDQVKAWAAAYVAESGQREKADARTADTIGIIQRCEAMANSARPAN